MPKTLTVQLFLCLVLDAKGQNVSKLKLIPVQRAAFASGRRNVCVCVCTLLCVPEPATTKIELSHAWRNSLCVLFHVKARESWSDAKVASAREAVTLLREEVTFK